MEADIRVRFEDRGFGEDIGQWVQPQVGVNTSHSRPELHNDKKGFRWFYYIERKMFKFENKRMIQI